jgi:hypothetical protein
MKRSLPILACFVLFTTSPTLAQAPKRAEVQQQIVELRSKLNALERQLLEPSPEDYAAFPGYGIDPTEGSSVCFRAIASTSPTR